MLQCASFGSVHSRMLTRQLVNTGTVLLCGIFDAAKGRLVVCIDQAVDKGGAETRQQRCRMRAFVYRHRGRRSQLSLGQLRHATYTHAWRETEETDEVKALERLLLCRTGRHG